MGAVRVFGVSKQITGTFTSGRNPVIGPDADPAKDGFRIRDWWDHRHQSIGRIGSLSRLVSAAPAR